MSNFRVTIQGIDQFAKRQATIIKRLSEKQIEAVAKESAKRIQFHILASIQRSGSTGNLAESFFAEPFFGGWGVGRIDYLNKQAPYWRWINFGRAGTGRTIPPGTNENPNIVGHFDAASGGRFRRGSPYFPINPTKPIAPHNFIAKTLNEQNRIISSTLKRVKI